MRSVIRTPLVVALLAAALLIPSLAVAHELFDHPAPTCGGIPAPTTASPSRAARARSGSSSSSIATGNPHSDLDFFRAAATSTPPSARSASRPNGGGQTIVQLTNGEEVAPSSSRRRRPHRASRNEAAALGLQHDVEASPKGGTILNTFNPFAARGDAKIVVDATDAYGPLP